MAIERLLRRLDPIAHRLDRWTGRRARRERGHARVLAARTFAYELGRWIGPVASRCGYGRVQPGETDAIFCGDPAVVLGRHPWARGEDDTTSADLGPTACVDLHVEWRDGFVELRADPFVRHSLLAPATGRDDLPAAMEQLARRLTAALDDEVVLEGTGPWDDPRPSAGSSGTLEWYARA